MDSYQCELQQAEYVYLKGQVYRANRGGYEIQVIDVVCIENTDKTYHLNVSYLNKSTGLTGNNTLTYFLNNYTLGLSAL
jgi:hypothetical protein